MGTKKAKKMNTANQSLQIDLSKGLLTISIGVNTLATAIENSPSNYEWLNEEGEVVRSFTINNPKAFAKEIVWALQSEEEDGTTLVNLMFDRAGDLAIEQGSDAVDLRADWIPVGTRRRSGP